jgi:carboxypeptidase Taq
VHESQSRLWENLIGRSDEFWRYFFPYAQEAFPAQLKDVSFEAFYAAINKVEPSLLRTESDEVTYNLHVMIRFDLELAMLEGDLAIRDLPAAWHDRYQSDLGVSSPTDANGVLQDVHWYAGLIGGSFQGYTLGNIMSSQIFEKALVENPGIKEDAANGSFEVLHNWLKDNIYTYGSKYEPDELIKRVTGNELDTGPLMRYMRSKFGALYNLD